jgi:hypothetical protein
MKFSAHLKASMMAAVIVAIIISTSYLAAGVMHDEVTGALETPAVNVTLVAIDTDGLGGTSEHPPLPAAWSSVGDYDLGVKVVGLRNENGVVIKLSLTRTGITTDDVEAYYYDTVSNSWRTLALEDKGNVLVATLGRSEGVDVYEGYEFVHRLIFFSHIDGACQVKAWAETE